MQGDTSLLCDFYYKATYTLIKLLVRNLHCSRFSYQKAVTPISKFSMLEPVHVMFLLSGCMFFEIRLLENPFDSVIENLPSDLHMEVIDLQSNYIFKDKFKEEN